MMTLREKITADLCRKKEHELFVKEKILPFFAGWKACEATEALYFAISEIQNNAVIR
mgnify:CR=1 FL=1